MINLISDTVTRPTPAMLESMMQAELGDDVFGQDPTVNALQERCAKMFGKEAALFCPSGTMTNQIAIKIHTQPLDEVICDHDSHIYQYETGGYSFHSGVAINLIEGENGKITEAQLKAAIKPVYDWLPISKLLVLENSCNKGGGSYYTLDEIRPIHDVCRSAGLRMHLDGARLFNVLVETGERTTDVGALFDTISICLSKGLGAPVGSVLIGDQKAIDHGRRLRKVMGGGMRQAGILAAAGLHALDHHIDRLKIDNEHARQLGEALSRQPYVKGVRPVKTNIVIFDLSPPWSAEKFVQVLRKRGISTHPFGPSTVRFVTHLEISDKMIQQAIDILESIRSI